MINSIEGSKKIKETQSSNFLFTHRLNDVVVNSKKSRLSRMMLGVGRLIGIEEIVCREMRSKAVLNNTLSKFR